MNIIDNTTIEEIITRLNREYPNRQPLLNYANPFELTVAVALSAQTTDAAVNRVTPELFSRWPTPASLANAPEDELQSVLHSLGFFRQKARNLMASSRILVERFNGKIPQSMADLTTLPGIGRKSANVIRAHIWNLPGIIVDTHFGRVCRRLGFSDEKDPVKLEKQMTGLIPENWQIEFSMGVNLHGRRYCKSRNPQCAKCPLSDLCQHVRHHL